MYQSTIDGQVKAPYLQHILIPQRNVIAIQKSMEIKSKMHFLIFVNTKSGDGHGKCYIELGHPSLIIRYQWQHEAHLYFYDLFNSNSREEGLTSIHRFLDQKQDNFRVIICGGDGTIPWVLGQLLRAKIDLTQVVLGIIPIGTGNDFSRSLGWGTDPVSIKGNNFQKLGLLVKSWMNATIGFYDMWDVEVETYANGNIYDIKDQRQIQRPERSFKKMFSNYVGIGIDARVVYTVEKHRSSYAFLNKVAYGLVGLCNFFRKIKKLEKKVQYFREVQETNFNTENKGEYQIQDSIIKGTFSNMQIQTGQKHTAQNKKYTLKAGYCGLVCLNCTSYMAGLRKVWKTKSVAVKGVSNSSFQEQKVDDGLLEFVGFKTELNLALQRIMRSGSKVLQGGGPFELQMKQPIHDEITYMQIDGQSIKIKNLKRYIITKTNRISDHRIRVLVNNQK